MKSISAELAYFLRGKARQNLKALVIYGFFLLFLTLLYAAIFCYLMLHLEGREFSYIAGIYWTITVMTTLGFGDITFHTDLGYLFATWVTLSGVLFLLIILPFGMISLFLAPWIEQRMRYRPLHPLPETTSGHVLIFGINPTVMALIHNLRSLAVPFVIVTDDYEGALRLEQRENVHVIYGVVTNKTLLNKVRIASARYVFSTLSDTQNVNLCLTIRSICATPIAVIVTKVEHLELIRQAGANKVIPLKRIVGNYLGVRSTTQGALAHIIDSFGLLKIAEVPVSCTPFSGQTLEQAQIRQRTGLAVVGILNRGEFAIPSKDSLLQPTSLVVLAGTREQLTQLESLTGEQARDDLVFILGHGMVGCSAASFLERRSVPFILLDQVNNKYCQEHVPILGDATNSRLLQEAGIDQAKGVVVTTNDDSTNIFLTLSSRQSNPYIRIVARSNSDENVDQLYAAGADFVISNASVGANILTNVLRSKESIFLTEGLTIFRRPLPEHLVGKTIEESQIRPQTGCSIVALERPDQDPLPSPPPETRLEAGTRLVLIGRTHEENKLTQLFGPKMAKKQAPGKTRRSP